MTRAAAPTPPSAPPWATAARRSCGASSEPSPGNSTPSSSTPWPYHAFLDIGASSSPSATGPRCTSPRSTNGYDLPHQAGMVDHPQPWAFGLATSHLDGDTAIDQAHRRERQIVGEQGGLLLSRGEGGPVSDQGSYAWRISLLPVATWPFGSASTTSGSY